MRAEGASADRGKPDIAAVVLAAGMSRRMGRNKMLLPVDGVPLVRRMAKYAIDAGLAPVVVVLGHEADQSRKALETLTVHFTVAPDPSGPTSSSLHAGLRALNDGVAAAVIMLADMPFVSTAMLRAIADSARAGSRIDASRYDGVFAPPFCFARELWSELFARHGNGCGKAVLDIHMNEARIHDWPLEALRDIDTPEDYATLVSLRPS